MALTSCVQKLLQEWGKYYKSMRAIFFSSTPKGDLPRYCVIFRKPEPLDVEFKNTTCPRLGVMLYLEI